MTEDRMPRGAFFAQLQGELFRLGVPVGKDLTGVRDICARMLEAANREAVDAATMFLTERDIAEACNRFAAEEQAAGRIANVARLRQAAQMIAKSVDHAQGAEIKVLMSLPPDTTEPLPAHMARRVNLVGRLIAPTQNTSLAPLHRLVAELMREAHETAFQAGYAKSAMDRGSIERHSDFDRAMRAGLTGGPTRSTIEAPVSPQDQPSPGAILDRLSAEDRWRHRNEKGCTVIEDPRILIPAADTRSVTVKALERIHGTLERNGRGHLCQPVDRILVNGFAFLGVGETVEAAQLDLWRRVCTHAAMILRSIAETEEDPELYEGAAVIGALTWEF